MDSNLIQNKILDKECDKVNNRHLQEALGFQQYGKLELLNGTALRDYLQ
jgi:hypothetical protein